MNEIPTFLKEKIQKQYPSLQDTIFLGYQVDRYPSFRINRLKTTREEIESFLKEEKIEYQTVSFFPDAFILRNQKESYLEKKEWYQEGKIYVQSLSSMLPVLFLDPKEKESILDMTSAPGGKTTEIASLTQDRALLMACEKSKIRYEKLKYNLARQGVKRITVLNQDARSLDDYFSFDKILLDAPCSGSGTFHVGENFSLELLEKLPKVQLELLLKAKKLLKKGGIILYSTCSILKEENEEIVKAVLKEGDLEIVPITLEGVPLLPTSLEGTITVLPNSQYEGFFMAKLRKKEEV